MSGQDKQQDGQSTTDDADKVSESEQGAPATGAVPKTAESRKIHKQTGSHGHRHTRSSEKHSVGLHLRAQKQPRAALWLSLLALALVLAATAAGYRVWQLQKSETQQAGLQLQQQQEQLQSDINRLQSKLTAIAQQQQSQQQLVQKQLDEALTSVREQLQQSRDPNWLLAEAEYLVRIANHRLQLARDIDSAITALSLADQRLQLLRDPRLLSVRRQLSDDITRLKAVTRIDSGGMALTLNSLQQQLEQLPLTGPLTLKHETGGGEEMQQAGEEKSWTDFFTAVWTSLKGLVSVRRVDDQAIAVVPPEQRGFLFQNLALKLEAARFALLDNDDRLYHQSLATARDWVQHYFENQDSAVRAMLTTLQQLDTVKLDAELPDASASLRAIQAAARAQQDDGKQKAAITTGTASTTRPKTGQASGQQPAAGSEAPQDSGSAEPGAAQ